jgi:hypothetical protein
MDCRLCSIKTRLESLSAASWLSVSDDDIAFARWEIVPKSEFDFKRGNLLQNPNFRILNEETAEEPELTHRMGMCLKTNS